MEIGREFSQFAMNERKREKKQTNKQKNCIVVSLTLYTIK